ncbi:MAG: methylmalonyl Co-A mutase-associated GTPase MeaB [Gemmatimonadota bacterium]
MPSAPADPAPRGRPDKLIEAFRAGRRAALARAISIVEDEREGADGLLDAIHADLGRAHRLGVTGPPGGGKSTLTAALIERLLARDESVGVVAVDPTSPFTGGALLGDRIRMNDVAQGPGVFIRSMATRGSLGGLALASKEVADVMDAFGFDRVIVETVGVGQSELDIAAAADTTVVVLVPESGDSVQAMKAGLMEIADLFVINKADRPGAEKLTREVELMLHLRAGQALRQVPAHHGVDLGKVRRRWSDRARARAAADATGAREAGVIDAPEAPAAEEEWTPPVLQTVARDGTGVDEVLATIEKHREWLAASGELERRRRERIKERVRQTVDRKLRFMAWRDGQGERLLEESMPALVAGNETPSAVAARIAAAVRG